MKISLTQVLEKGGIFAIDAGVLYLGRILWKLKPDRYVYDAKGKLNHRTETKNERTLRIALKAFGLAMIILSGFMTDFLLVGLGAHPFVASVAMGLQIGLTVFL